MAGGGEMGARIRAHDWAATPLGPPTTWPQSLRSALSICLHSRFPTAIYWGLELRLLYNDAWVPIPAERHPLALGRPGAEVWADIWDVVGPQFDRVIDTGEGFSTFDQMLPMVRNSVRTETYWNYSFTPIRGERGAVAGILNQGHETTDRILADRAREAAAARQHRLFQQAPGFITILRGPDHKFEFVNRAYCALFGDRGYIGKTVRDAFPELAGQGFFEWLDQVYRTGERWVADRTPVDLKTADGTTRQFVLNFIYEPVTDETGRVTGIFCEGHDVTAAYRAEEALRDLNETLEQRVALRTAELEKAQEALRQSQKLEAMGQLTGGVAHDFNNLLTPIVGGLDMLQRRGIGDERAQRQIHAALASAERAKTLVQRLLAFARRQPLQPTAVDIRQLVDGMAELIASTSGPRIKLEIDVAPDLPPARADSNQLEMAILNLAVNSRDAMPDGGRMTIAATHETVAAGHRSGLPAGAYVRLAVSDTGVGMNTETVSRAVEPFFSTKGIGQGTGLGLSMVHGLALQLGGALTIRSRPKLGTNIELWLPAASDTGVTSDVAEPCRAVAMTGVALLVDDEESVRTSTADMLIDLGFDVMEAGSGEEALRLIEENGRPDLLITDHLMPGMTGTDLARKLNQDGNNVSVLIMSGYAEDDTLPTGLARLVKPFRQAELAASIDRLLGER